MFFFFHTKGRYGFTKGLENGLNFKSVPDLVNYYRVTSLKDYNTILDIKLLYPVSRFNQDEHDDDAYNNRPEFVDKLIQKYLDGHKELTAKESAFDNYWSLYKRIEHDIDIKRQAFEAFHEAEQLFNDQLKTQQRLETEAQPHEIISLKENLIILKARLKQLLDCQTDLQYSYEKQKTQFLALERNIQSLKPILNDLRKSEERYVT